MMQPPIFIINMDGCEDRWQTTYTRLQEVGLDASRFSATNGKQLPESEVATWYDQEANLQRYHRHLTPGEIGCYISHYRIYEKVVNENLPYALVLEDDLHIEDSLASLLALIPDLKGWDMIKLSDNRANPFIDTRALNEQFTLGNYKKVPNGTQGYLISLAGAKKLLNRKPFYRPVDVDLQFHGEIGLRVVGIKPYPVSEDISFESEIAILNKGQHSGRSTFTRNAKHRIRLFLQRQFRSATLKDIL
ncbi:MULTISPECIES: glycosyltransferase family 25 protein [Pseudoalteromonas]|uniref:glycosyltransferase family 25 protein n=1 Tax=Pseudoalteromonas TaxID=53246 RepID=UPI001E3908F8|nr:MULTISPECIES: glycosyltransferase family 25 protein [Pseudoalteromonas]MCG7562014.1 glycosyltransferase family 25 protein [Pseudoalteromonas sp. McH1-42]MEC4088381.1 glycosyltransferase family 25 protein [Pseudoalteromonas rubra]